jgi:hypothetical protein
MRCILLAANGQRGGMCRIAGRRAWTEADAAHAANRRAKAHGRPPAVPGWWAGPAAGSTWADITLDIAGGATQVGFSLQQNEYAIDVSINGSLHGSLPAGGGIRTGYFRFDVTDGAPITQIRLDGHPGDAWVIDHLAITAAVPEPGALALVLAGLAVVGSAVRRQRSR